MLKIFMRSIVVALLFLFVSAGNVLAAGSVSEGPLVKLGHKGEYRSVTFTCVGDSSDGSIPATQLSDGAYGVLKDGGYRIHRVIIDPGTVQPAPGSSVYFNATEGDNTSCMLGGAGIGELDDADTESFPPECNGVPDNVELYSQPYLEASQSTASAEWTVTIVFEKRWAN